jgi:Resolvase, N terminal domain
MPLSAVKCHIGSRAAVAGNLTARLIMAAGAQPMPDHKLLSLAAAVEARVKEVLAEAETPSISAPSLSQLIFFSSFRAHRADGLREVVTSTAEREKLRALLDFLRKGDSLMVTRIDRLARNIGDLQDIVRTGEGARRIPQGHKATDRREHRSRQMLPRYAWRVRRVRDEPPSRTSA